MSNHTFGVRTICPFYQREADKSITCEGVIPGTTASTHFDSKGEKRLFQEQHCELREYEKCCPLAAALMRKYEDDHEQDKPAANAERMLCDRTH